MLCFTKKKKSAWEAMISADLMRQPSLGDDFVPEIFFRPADMGKKAKFSNGDCRKIILIILWFIGMIMGNGDFRFYVSWLTKATVTVRYKYHKPYSYWSYKP